MEIKIPKRIRQGLSAALVTGAILGGAVLGPEREVIPLFERDITGDGIPEVFFAKRSGRTTYEICAADKDALHKDEEGRLRLKNIGRVYPFYYKPLINSTSEGLEDSTYEFRDFDNNGYYDLKVRNPQYGDAYFKNLGKVL